MSELMYNAGEGWRAFNTNGKLMVLFLAAILFLWFGTQNYRKGAAGRLLTFACVVGACCILPVTAAVFMSYQTRFYDYQWIWCLVPVSILTAYGCVVFLVQLKEDTGKKTFAVATAMLLVIFFLCGNLGHSVWEQEEEKENRIRAEAVLGEVMQQLGDTDACLWAPEEILEYARSYNGEIRLLYGRNMWDAALGAYSYDTYDEMRVKLYCWMEREDARPVNVLGGDQAAYEEEMAVETLTERDIATYLDFARSQGVNVILLANTLPEEELRAVTAYLSVAPMAVADYYLYVL